MNFRCAHSSTAEDAERQSLGTKLAVTVASTRTTTTSEGFLSQTAAIRKWRISNIGTGLYFQALASDSRAGFPVGSAYGIRTRVTAVRGRRPGPLDECAGSAGTR